MCPGVAIPKIRTTAELAKDIASASPGGSYELYELSHDLDCNAPHLLAVVVRGMSPIQGSNAQKSMQNKALLELRKLSAPSGPAMDEASALVASSGALRAATPRGKGRAREQGHRVEAQAALPDIPAGADVNDRGVAEQSLLMPGPEVDSLLVDEGGGAADDPFSDMDPSDIMEVIEAHQIYLSAPDAAAEASPEELADPEADTVLANFVAGDAEPTEEIAPGQSSSSDVPIAPADASARAVAAPAATAATAPRLAVLGPSKLGYSHDPRSGKHVARISPVFNKSVSVKCDVHPRCQVAMVEWKLSPLAELREWVMEAQSGGSDANAAKVHMAALKSKVASAQCPGRLREDVIAEAEAEADALARNPLALVWLLIGEGLGFGKPCAIVAGPPHCLGCYMWSP